jgi:hypothetical protein
MRFLKVKMIEILKEDERISHSGGMLSNTIPTIGQVRQQGKQDYNRYYISESNLLEGL